MSIRVLVLFTGLVAMVHQEALAATAPMNVGPGEQRFETKLEGTTSAPTAGAPRTAQPGSSKPPASATKERVLTGNPLWAIPLSRLTATGRSPLFAPTRLPPPVAAVVKPPPVIAAPPPKPVESGRPELSLLGTVGGSKKIGLFIDQAGKTVVRLNVGENYKGWILRAVSRRQVELARGLDTAVLELPPPAMKAGGAPPPATPALAGAPPSFSGLPANPDKATGSPPRAIPASATIAVQPPPGSPPAPVNPFLNGPPRAAR